LRSRSNIGGTSTVFGGRSGGSCGGSRRDMSRPLILVFVCDVSRLVGLRFVVVLLWCAALSCAWRTPRGVAVARRRRRRGVRALAAGRGEAGAGAPGAIWNPLACCDAPRMHRAKALTWWQEGRDDAKSPVQRSLAASCAVARLVSLAGRSTVLCVVVLQHTTCVPTQRAREGKIEERRKAPRCANSLLARDRAPLHINKHGSAVLLVHTATHSTI
jgi:hypothetical protein